MEIATIVFTAITFGLTGASLVLVNKDDPRASHKLPSVLAKRIRQINRKEIERLAKELTRSKKRTRI